MKASVSQRPQEKHCRLREQSRADALSKKTNVAAQKEWERHGWEARVERQVQPGATGFRGPLRGGSMLF